MALTTDQRKAVSSQYQRRRESFGTCSKAELLAAVNGLDDYLETNAAAINSAIPQPARAQLSTKQKALLLALVCLLRWEAG